MQRACLLILSLIAIFGLSGCGPVTMSPVSTYTISAPHIVKSNKSKRRYKTNKTILVSMPIASPGYQSNKMVYVTVPFRLRYFANNQWVAPPANMLLTLLAENLRQTNYFKAVLTAPFIGMTTYRLDTQLLILQQEFLQPISQERMVMQATLINSANNHVIASRRFQVVVKAPENDPYSGVLAANQAAATLSALLTRFVLRTIR